MGYTTTFSGQFNFDKSADDETVLFVRDLEGQRKVPGGAPDSYCQWVITQDRLHLEWDSGEKFYDWQEWLQWLIDHKFTPAGITLTGSVKYQGEEVEDCGTLSVVDGRTRKTPASFEYAKIHCPRCGEDVEGRIVT